MLNFVIPNRNQNKQQLKQPYNFGGQFDILII